MFDRSSINSSESNSKNIAQAMIKTNETMNLQAIEDELDLRMGIIINATGDILDMVTVNGINNIFTVLTNQYGYETSTLS